MECIDAGNLALEWEHQLLQESADVRLWRFLPLLLVQRSIWTDSVVSGEGGETSLRYQSVTARQINHSADST